jgi:hypothetical protein
MVLFSLILSTALCLYTFSQQNRTTVELDPQQRLHYIKNQSLKENVLTLFKNIMDQFLLLQITKISLQIYRFYKNQLLLQFEEQNASE